MQWHTATQRILSHGPTVQRLQAVCHQWPRLVIQRQWRPGIAPVGTLTPPHGLVLATT